MSTFVSLFAGVGGFDLGFEQAGHTCVGQVEIDKYAQKVLKKHWPDVPLHDDVTTAVEWAKEIDLIGRVDIVCGGFPCQDVSVAGKRVGIAGARSGLFWDAIRFAQEVKAQTIVLENVPGLLSSNNGRDFGVVISAMADAGYRHIEWRVLDSQFFGVAQRRRRVFIVGSTADRSGQPILVEQEGLRGHSAQGRTTGQDATGEAPQSSVARMRGFGDYAIDQTASALKARDYKDATDIVINGFTPSSFANYQEGAGTLRANGGDLGGGSEILLVRSKPETTRA